MNHRICTINRKLVSFYSTQLSELAKMYKRQEIRTDQAPKPIGN